MINWFQNVFGDNLGMFLGFLTISLLLLVPLLVSLAFVMWWERRIWAAVWYRIGPNIVGPFGILQSFADFIKYMTKEVIIPSSADKVIFLLAPLITVIMSLVAWAVIPFNEGWVVSNVNVGILFIFAVSSLEVYGVIMGGWASNSKYPFLGALRSAAQMISYEVSIGLIIIGILISTGSLNLSDIVNAQSGGLLSWHFIAHFPMLILFYVSALAETNRPPFDLPEAEAELVAGYQVEYSSTPFLLFMLGELAATVLMCALIAILFFGGWQSPIGFLPDGFLWMPIKMIAIFWIFGVTKAMVPRYRYDQLMRLGWKVFLPLSLAWVVFVAFMAFNDVSLYARWDLLGG